MELIEYAETEVRISPESLRIAESYIENDFDARKAAIALDLPLETIVSFVNKKEVKRFIDSIFLDQGYFNRKKLQDVISNLIERKLEELDETELGSNKDIADLIALAHKMRMDEIKIMTPEKEDVKKQTNVQINNDYGNNYQSLITNIIKDGNI